MTGTNDDRPDFQRMIADSFNHGFDYVIVYKLDRFSRSRYDSAIHKRTLQNNGVRVISATESISDSPEGIMFESILEGCSEYYSRELSAKVRRELKESRIKGNYTGGFPLYGYDIVDKKWKINERESENVRNIFTDCSKGVLLKNIAAGLNAKQQYTKTNMPWTLNGISKVLNNERYCGVLRVNGEVYTNIFPPIISEELFKKVGLNMEANNRWTAHFRTPAAFYLGGKLFCMHCGKPINGESGTGRADVYYYYKCQSNKRKKGTCPKKVVRRDMLEDYIIEKIQQCILQRKYITTIAADMTNNFNAKVKGDDSLNILKREQSQNEREINNTLSAIKSGLTNQLTNQLLEQLAEKKEQLAIEVAKLSSRKARTIDADDCADFLFSLTALDYSAAENRELLFNRFIRRVELATAKSASSLIP